MLPGFRSMWAMQHLLCKQESACAICSTQPNFSSSDRSRRRNAAIRVVPGTNGKAIQGVGGFVFPASS